MLCAELVLSLKNKYPNIQLECAIPCKNQTRNWQTKNIIGYNQIISKADLITFVSYKNYYKGCMQKRNKYGGQVEFVDCDIQWLCGRDKANN